MRLVDAVYARITELLKQKGLTLYRVATDGGVPYSTLATMTNSKNVTLATIYGVCAGFKITLTEFFNSPIFDENNIID